MEQCENCGATTESVEEALDKNWISSYLDFNSGEEKGTLCFTCQEKLGVKYNAESMSTLSVNGVRKSYINLKGGLRR